MENENLKDEQVKDNIVKPVVSGSLQSEAIEFAEWIRTFESLDKKHGFWVIERQLSSEELYYHYLRDRERWRNDR